MDGRKGSVAPPAARALLVPRYDSSGVATCASSHSGLNLSRTGHSGSSEAYLSSRRTTIAGGESDDDAEDFDDSISAVTAAPRMQSCCHVILNDDSPIPSPGKRPVRSP